MTKLNISGNDYYTYSEVDARISHEENLNKFYARSSKWKDNEYTHLKDLKDQKNLSIDEMFNKVYEELKDYKEEFLVKNNVSKATFHNTLYLKKDFAKNDGKDYKFNVIDKYYDYNTIDAKFYAVDQVLNNSYYKKTDKTPDQEAYKFNVIHEYSNYNTIDAKFYAIDQLINNSYYKKKKDEKTNQSMFKVLVSDYQITTADTIDAKFHAVDRYLNDNISKIEKIQKSIDNNGNNISNQTSKIENNKKTIDDQAKLIKDNESHILKKIEELREIVNKNKEQISLNTKEVRPLNEVTTKIFNTLAAQDNEKISLNTEVIEDNNELLKDKNESLNKMDKKNDALYVMAAALAAPFIGLSLYYSSDTEENIGNEIKAF